MGIEPPYVAEQIAKHVITWPVRKLALSVCELQPCPQNQSITNNHRCNDCYLIQPYLCRINSTFLITLFLALNVKALATKDYLAYLRSCAPRLLLRYTSNLFLHCFLYNVNYY